MKKDKDNNSIIPSTRENVDDISTMILKSTSDKDRGVAMDSLFTKYRYALSQENQMIMTSGIEDSVYKILNDANESRAREKYMPFTRLIAIINEQQAMNKKNNGFLNKCLLLSETWSDNRDELNSLIKKIFKIEIEEI